MSANQIIFSTTTACEKIAQMVFDTLPDQGITILIVNTDGSYLASDPEELQKLKITSELLQRLCAKIDDGAEPVITQLNDCSIIGKQLSTQKGHLGYTIIVLPQYSAESTLININLVETLLNQFSVIAELIYQNRLWQETDASDGVSLRQGAISLN